MTTYVTIPDSAIDEDSPITFPTLAAFRDNLRSVVEQDASAIAAGLALPLALPRNRQSWLTPTMTTTTWTVPSGVTRLFIALRGGDGGKGGNAGSGPDGGDGGRGATLYKQVPVTPGDVIDIIAGGKGGDGTDVGSSTAAGGGGGGGSRVTIGATAYVAGGGGGGGGGGTDFIPDASGGDAGSSGNNGDGGAAGGAAGSGGVTADGGTGGASNGAAGTDGSTSIAGDMLDYLFPALNGLTAGAVQFRW